MRNEKKLGRISKVSFGLGGYQEAMLGIHFQFSFEGSGIGTSECYWSPELIKCSDKCQWTEEDRSKAFDEIMRYVAKLLSDAKVMTVDQLQGIPVEVALKDFNSFDSFRILTEVL